MFKWNYDFTSGFAGEAAIGPELCLDPHPGCGWGVHHTVIDADTARVGRGVSSTGGNCRRGPALSWGVGRGVLPSTAGPGGHLGPPNTPHPALVSPVCLGNPVNICLGFLQCQKGGLKLVRPTKINYLGFARCFALLRRTAMFSGAGNPPSPLSRTRRLPSAERRAEKTTQILHYTAHFIISPQILWLISFTDFVHISGVF